MYKLMQNSNQGLYLIDPYKKKKNNKKRYDMLTWDRTVGCR